MYTNFSILSNHAAKLQRFSRVFINFNSTDEIFFQFKNFDNLIVDSGKYLQMCQGENTLKELYLYLNNQEKNRLEIFTSVFGNFTSSFFRKNETNELEDLSINGTTENNIYFNQNEEGYLKIQCKFASEEVVLKSSYITSINFYLIVFEISSSTFSPLVFHSY